jgi:hypothetical protein
MPLFKKANYPLTIQEDTYIVKKKAAPMVMEQLG